MGLPIFVRIPGWLPWDGSHGPWAHWHLNKKFPGGYRHLRFQVVGGRPRHVGKGCLRNTGAQKKKKMLVALLPKLWIPNGEYPAWSTFTYMTIWKDPSCYQWVNPLFL